MSDQREAAHVLPVTSLTEYFRDSLQAALRKQQLAVDGHTQHYVVNVLTLFARSEALFEQTPDGLRLKPLVAMLSEAPGRTLRMTLAGYPEAEMRGVLLSNWEI